MSPSRSAATAPRVVRRLSDVSGRPVCALAAASAGGLARQLALRLRASLPASNEKIGFDYKVQRLLQGSLLRRADAHLYWNGTFSEAEKKRLHLRNGHPSGGRIAGHSAAAIARRRRT